MTREKSRRPLTLVAAVLVLGGIIGAVVYVWNGKAGAPDGSLQVVVEQEGTVVYRTLLRGADGSLLHADEQLRFVGSAGEYVVEFQRGKVRMHSAHCPDKVCVNEGWTDQPVKPIICLPQKVIISVERLKKGQDDAEGGDLDALVR